MYVYILHTKDQYKVRLIILPLSWYQLSGEPFLNSFTTASAAAAASTTGAPMAPSSHHSDDSFDSSLNPPDPAAASVIQVVNIRSHVPVVLDLDEGNYSQWRCFFDSVLDKFGLTEHVCSPTPTAERDAEWQLTDPCIVNWILLTVSKSVFDIVHKLHLTAFSLWTEVESLFHDNELQRAVYLEAELHSTYQGDLSINEYCTKLKRLADQLRSIGHPISEPS